ncbi:30S ribosomal protein S15 [candidate division WOR-3 bacterium]|nr:30S ribosomal protein S15 [candidate division WOR-3 bacterium]
MEINTKEKKQLIKKFGRHEKDTGSPEVQIALISEKIKELTEHLKEHRKDFHSQRGLLNLASKRKRLLNYLRRKDYDRFVKVVKDLDIRV